MPMATPADGLLNTSCSMVWPSSPTNLIDSVPLPGNRKSVALYWSPNAWRPTMIGWVQPGTRRGTFWQMIGSRKITPPRMLRIGRDGRALDGHAVLLGRLGRVDRDLVAGGVAVLDAEVEIVELQVQVR